MFVPQNLRYRQHPTRPFTKRKAGAPCVGDVDAIKSRATRHLSPSPHVAAFVHVLKCTSFAFSSPILLLVGGFPQMFSACEPDPTQYNCRESLIPDMARSKKQVNRRVALSLFSGAGGMDIGVRDAGFEILACIEHDPQLVARS
jgi:hypothetical protein